MRRACVEVGGLGCGELAAAAGACRGWAAALAGAAAGPPGRLGLGTPLAHRLAFPLATPPGQADPWEPPRRCLRLQGGGAGDERPALGRSAALSPSHLLLDRPPSSAPGAGRTGATGKREAPRGGMPPEGPVRAGLVPSGASGRRVSF